MITSATPSPTDKDNNKEDARTNFLLDMTNVEVAKRLHAIKWRGNPDNMLSHDRALSQKS